MLDPFEVWSAIEIIYRRSNSVVRAEKERPSTSRSNEYSVIYGLEAEIYDEFLKPDDIASNNEVSSLYVTADKIAELLECSEEEAAEWLDRFDHYDILKQTRPAIESADQQLYLPTREDPSRVLEVLHALRDRMEDRE